MGIIILIILVIVGLGIYFASRKLGERTNPEIPGQPATIEGRRLLPDTDSLYRVAEQLEEFFNKSAHPKDLLENEDFKRGVEMLSSEHYSEEELIAYYAGDNQLIACMALVALKRRAIGQDTVDQIVYHLGVWGPWPLYFVFDAIVAHCRTPAIGAVLLQAPAWWINNRMLLTMLQNFVKARIAGGEQPVFGEKLSAIGEKQLEYLSALIDTLQNEALQPLAREIRHGLKTRVDRPFLNSIGRLWAGSTLAQGCHVNDHLKACLHRMEQALTGDGARSVILTGQAGVGKTTLVKALADRLHRRGLSLFEAGAAEIIAGQRYIGDLEGRLRTLVKNLDRRRGLVWFVPNFHELLYAGRHRYNPAGVLDILMPYIVSGAITLVGETRPAALSRLTRDNPRLKSIFEVVSIEPMGQAETLSLARQWAALHAGGHLDTPLIAEDVLREALQLVQQFIGDYAAPGNLLDLLKLTRQSLFAEDNPTRTIQVDDLYRILSQLTGLPRSILDEREGLDIDDLRGFFARRVMGQTEAVDCLVERIAMIKAGLTDPSRPLGVFLFAGPTGTGKTEIAKTLAEFLFGSPERIVRLDMSEFKTAVSEDRILGDTSEGRNAGALVNQIRRQPFSVVLLDEFEKAHSNIWDLFLQVFDDGRLTDRHGNTADFRHAIIILTSNMGATIRPGAGIGFNPENDSFSMHQVRQAISRTFRPEFINRLDRVVVFQPLRGSVMRAILHKELDHVLQRRGLRNREWAVEWEESAIDFLLEKGFTADLGARPLKRAIEQYLLAPLAVTIVNHSHPQGDQFLFVRAESNRIEVEFIDPDAPVIEDAAVKDEKAEQGLPDPTALKTMILAPDGAPAEVDVLAGTVEKLSAAIRSGRWQSQKAEGLQQMAETGFWERTDCYATLGRVECMDRIEAGMKTAGSLLQRLRGRDGQPRAAYSRKIITRLAEQLYLLEEACRSLDGNLPQDAFLSIEPLTASPPGENDGSGDFAVQLRRMYRGWAARRRMRVEVLEDFDTREELQGRFVMAVSGYGAYSILRAESGLHVFEKPKNMRGHDRLTIRVRVAGQPDTPASGIDQLRRQVAEIFDAEDSARNLVVRRYRAEPSPLVRDAVRNYRTGLLTRVLDGDFDLFG
jgi:ATP-dependent Clp protease ATP-binding subunit ClpC